MLKLPKIDQTDFKDAAVCHSMRNRDKTKKTQPIKNSLKMHTMLQLDKNSCQTTKSARNLRQIKVLKSSDNTKTTSSAASTAPYSNASKQNKSTKS